MHKLSLHIETYNITVTKSGTPIAGEMYSLVCTVEVSPGSPNVTWMFDGKVVSTVGTVTVGSPETSGTTTVLTVTFGPLYTSHGGEYTCQSVVGRAQVKREVNETIIVGSKSTLSFIVGSKSTLSFIVGSKSTLSFIVGSKSTLSFIVGSKSTLSFIVKGLPVIPLGAFAWPQLYNIVE